MGPRPARRRFLFRRCSTAPHLVGAPPHLAFQGGGVPEARAPGGPGGAPAPGPGREARSPAPGGADRVRPHGLSHPGRWTTAGAPVGLHRPDGPGLAPARGAGGSAGHGRGLVSGPDQLPGLAGGPLLPRPHRAVRDPAGGSAHQRGERVLAHAGGGADATAGRGHPRRPGVAATGAGRVRGVTDLPRLVVRGVAAAFGGPELHHQSGRAAGGAARSPRGPRPGHRFRLRSGPRRLGAGAALSRPDLTGGVAGAGEPGAAPVPGLCGSPVAAGITLAGGIALVLAFSMRLVPLRWAPAVAALAAALLFQPLPVRPFPAGLAASVLFAGLLVWILRRFGLTVLLTASLVSFLLPAAALSLRYPDWLAGGFAATAGLAAVLLLLGVMGLSRPAAAESQRLAPPGFVRRMEDGAADEARDGAAGRRCSAACCRARSRGSRGTRWPPAR